MTSPLTDKESRDLFDMILKTELKMTDTKPVMLALDEMGIDNIVDLSCLTNEEIDEMTYDVAGTDTRVPFKERKMLKQILQWRDHMASITISHHVNWSIFSASGFLQFKQDIGSGPSGQVHPTMTTSSTVTRQTIDNFDANMKFDIKQFPIFDGTLEK